MGLLKVNENLRLDQYFAYNITNFKKYGKEDEILIKNLIAYMSLVSQKNLFGFVSIDIAHFCNTMSLDRANIVRKHKDPIFYKLFNDKTPEEHQRLEEKFGKFSKYRIWDSVLENALLILENEKFYFSDQENDETHSKIRLSNFTYIKELSIVFKKSYKTKKIIYQYKPTEEFEEKLVKLFVSSNILTFIKMRKPSLEDFYLKALYIMQLESSRNNNNFAFDFEELAKLMNVSTKNIQEKNGFSLIKRNINTKFKKHFIKNSSEDKNIKYLRLDWKKGPNSRYLNVPVLTWSINKEELKERDKKVYEDIFYTELCKALSKNYQENYMPLVIDYHKLYVGFVKWFFTIKDFEVKKSLYVSVFSKIRGNQRSSLKEAHDFFYKLIEIGKYLESYQLYTINENNQITFKDIIQNKEFYYPELKFFIYDIKDNLNYFEKNYNKP